MENEPAIVTGDVENIVIKPEPLFDEEDETVWLEDTDDKDDISDVLQVGFDGPTFVTSTGEIVAINNVQDSLVQTPFYLESYFSDTAAGSGGPKVVNEQEAVVRVDRVTCYQCNIVFCNEHRLLEHLMTHIDVYRMGCGICDKDLNLAEKFQLHMMAVTWQSVYYCDFCRKSCAGVVRSKSHPPPPSKIYMCHDCEYQTKEPYVLEIRGCVPPESEILQEERPGEPKECENTSDCCSKKPSKTDPFVTSSNSRTCFSAKDKITSIYRCRHCPCIFSDHWTLLNHLRADHNFLKLHYVCKHCAKEITTQRCYDNHMSFHKLIKNYMCFVCNLAFLSIFELEQHAELHESALGTELNTEDS